jgi:hypothetical protein
VRVARPHKIVIEIVAGRPAAAAATTTMVTMKMYPMLTEISLLVTASSRGVDG